MLEVTILASGSSGNALLLRGEEATVLIDAGISARRLTSGIASCGLDPSDLDGILLTHEHGDHTQGLKVFCRKSEVPIYANAHTAQALQAGGLQARWKIFQTGSPFLLGGLKVETFNVPHDAADPVGFCVESAGIRFAVLTDLGHASTLVVERVRNVDAILIEANYDTDLLQNDPKRPWAVKQRISSRHGHLSNAAAAEVLAHAAASRLRHALLGHLSRDCNTPDLASSAALRAMQQAGRSDIELFCAEPNVQSQPFRFE